MIFMASLHPGVASEDRSSIVALHVPAVEDLVGCSYGPFNVAFLCDPKWQVHEDEDLVVYSIASSPAVSLSITKVSDNLKSIEQVNKADLALTGQYADGFVLQDDTLGNKRVKMVMGFSRASVEIRYLDYYILNEGKLYSLLFAVDPKEAWDSYKFLIKAIAQSFDFR